MADGAVTGLELMERAGRGVVEAVLAHWPDLAAAPHRAVVFCGPGNNGGDGFVIARLLKARGWDVAVYLQGDPDRLPPDARRNHAHWCAMGQVRPLSDLDRPLVAGAAVVFDALFGTGLVRPVEGAALVSAMRDLAHCVAQGSPRVVAVDIPSGLCTDSGRVLTDSGSEGPGCGGAHLTVSFHRAKLGHVLAEGPALCGSLHVVDIGLDGADGPDMARLVAAPAVSVIGKGEGHKYTHGHALVLAGPMGRTGAARLVARAALRVGAGLVTVGAPGGSMAECAAQLTAIMLRQVDGAGTLGEMLADPRITAVCLGPGLGSGTATRDAVRVALGASHRPGVVLDADALTAFADASEALFEILHAGCVLTPHMGEFARLFPDLAERLSAPATRGPAFSRVDAARAAAERAGCTLLLKGVDTIIASPGGAVAIHAAAYGRAAPWLATAGAGDVLAGVIAGLVARGLPAQDAAETATWLHVEAARAVGPGLIAEDLPEALPQVLRDLSA